MFKVESDFDKFYRNHVKTLDQLKSADKVLREAAFDSVVIISDRVQQKGLKTDGDKISSKSKKKTGAYSFYYGRKRAKDGFQTGHIDMTYSGDMMGDFVPVPVGQSEYAIGFRGKKTSDVAEFNEMRFGTIFHLSESELNFIMKKINKKVNEILS